MQVLRITGLPDDPLEAAAVFHAGWLPRIQALMSERRPDGDLLLAFASANHTHRDWRLAAVRGLAREGKPLRINAVAGDDERAVESAARYLADAPGVTGQYLPLDGAGAGPVVGLVG